MDTETAVAIVRMKFGQTAAPATCSGFHRSNSEAHDGH